MPSGAPSRQTNCRARRAARGQHGIEHDQIALGRVHRQFAIVFHRLERFRIAIQADVSHLRRGNQLENAVHHAQARAQNRNHAQFAAAEHLGLAAANRRIDLYVFQRQVARGLIGEQHGNFLEQFAEFFDSRVLIAHNREFVLHQRMIQNV